MHPYDKHREEHPKGFRNQQMASSAPAGQSQGMALVAVGGMLALAVVFGWAVGEGLTGLPMFAMVLIGTLATMLMWPNAGLIGLVLFYCGAGFLPQSGYTTQTYVTGLNAINITFISLMAAWAVGFFVSRRKLRPLGSYGKLLIAYMVIVGIGTLRGTMRNWGGLPDLSPLVNALPELRIMYLIPITVLFIIQTDLTRGGLVFLLYGFVAIFVASFGWQTHTILTSNASYGMLRHILAEGPGALTLAIGFFCVAAAILILTRSKWARAFWIGAVILGAYPFVYQQGRAIYLSVFVGLVVTVMILAKGNRQNRSVGIALLIAVGLAVTAFAPMVIARLKFAFYDPSGTQRVDPSIGVRFEIWEGVLKTVVENPMLLLVGGGAGMENIVSRQYIGHGLGSHNTWLAALLRYGLGYHVIVITLLVKQYRVLRAVVDSSESNIIRGFAAGFAGSLIGYQVHLMTHQVFPVGRYEMMMWSVAAIAISHMMPGGIFADLKLPDGRPAASLAGIHIEPTRRPEPEAIEPEPEPALQPAPGPIPRAGRFPPAGSQPSP